MKINNNLHLTIIYIWLVAVTLMIMINVLQLRPYIAYWIIIPIV